MENPILSERQQAKISPIAAVGVANILATLSLVALLRRGDGSGAFLMPMILVSCLTPYWARRRDGEFSLAKLMLILPIGAVFVFGYAAIGQAYGRSGLQWAILFEGTLWILLSSAAISRFRRRASETVA